jgi:hypothetical protein
MKIPKVGAELFRTDGETDIDAADSHFSQFCVRTRIKNVLLF